MLILTLRTDKPEAEVGVYEDQQELVYDKWEAHRQLAETLHSRIEKNLQGIGKDWAAIGGIVVFQGPGSYTGLRIGISVANALAASLEIPIVGNGGDNWLDEGVKTLASGANDKHVLPEYGAPAFTTAPRK